MLKVLKLIVYASAFVINLVTWPIKVKNQRIVFISYFSNQLEGNFKIIYDELKKRGGYDIRLLLKKYEGSIQSKFHYFFNILRQAYYYNTAKVVVLDANSIVMNAIIKKKKTIVVQIWHGCAGFKKIGQDTRRLYRVKSCDVAVTSCEKVRRIYADALRIPIERVFALGAPRTDTLFSKEKINESEKKLYGQYGIPAGKKLLLYAPTFRGSGIDDVSMPKIDLISFAQQISEDYVLGLRLHPLIRNFNCPGNVIDLTNEDLMEVLAATDILITDYSTVVFEYAILERPMIFHAPDLEYYKTDRGFYMDYEAFVPGPITKTQDELLAAIKNISPDKEKLMLVKHDYFDSHNGCATQRVADFISRLCSLPDAESVSAALRDDAE